MGKKWACTSDFLILYLSFRKITEDSRVDSELISLPKNKTRNV